jgi:hypothetical protein
MRPPHLIDYRIYSDEEGNLCLKGRAFYFFYVLAIMLTLCVGLPIAFFNDKTIVITGTVLFLLFFLFVLGLWTSVKTIFFKPIQRSITIARRGTIVVSDTMMIGRRSSEMKLDEINSIAFVYSYLSSGILHDYRVIARFKDGSERFLVDEDVLLFEKSARKAMRELSALLEELHRDSAIAVRECRSDQYGVE